MTENEKILNYEFPIFEFMNKLEDVYNKKESWGYSTGFYEYDNITKGLSDSELTVIAARHSMGKSTFVLNLALNLAQQDIPVLFISYDLDKTAISQRLLSSIAEVDAQRMKEGTFSPKDWEKISEAISILDNLNKKQTLNIISGCYLYYKDMFDLIRKFKEDHNKGVVIVDYFQQIKLYKQEDTRIIELSSLASAFKHLAMEIDMPIILVSQVSKKCEDRSDKRPILSDLAECDALAQHCDNLAFIYRDEYYDNDNPENKNKSEFIFAKQKNGPRGNFELLYQAPIFKFKNPVQIDAF